MSVGVPCLANCEHRAPADAIIFEAPVRCDRCDHLFLRRAHEVTEAELTLLRLLKHFSDEDNSRMYAIAKHELLDLRGSRYCNDCRFNPVPMSERIQ